MPSSSVRGFSLVETLVALALIATVSAAVLPAIVLASRLQADSAIETEAAAILASRLETLKADVAAGVLDGGGAIDTRVDGWHALMPAFECRWQISPLAAPGGARIIAVRVLPLAKPSAAITIATVVPDG